MMDEVSVKNVRKEIGEMARAAKQGRWDLVAACARYAACRLNDIADRADKKTSEGAGQANGEGAQ